MLNEPFFDESSGFELLPIDDGGTKAGRSLYYTGSDVRLTRNILLSEIVPSDIFVRFGPKALRFVNTRIDNGLQYLLDTINKTYKSSYPIIINTWVNKGRFELRGYRPPNCSQGAQLSDHKLGIARDFNIGTMLSSDIRKFILDREQKMLANGITTLESDTDGWVHCSCRTTGRNKILMISPGS